MGRRACLILAFGLCGGFGCGGVRLGAAPDASTHGGATAPVDAGAEPDAGPSSATCTLPAGVRMLAPIAGSTLTLAAVRLTVDPAASAGVDVQICRDRACAQVAWQVTTGGRVATSPELQPGYWFWRARQTGSGDTGWLSAWQFRIRPRAPGYEPTVNTAAELFRDINEDGYPDATLYGPVDATICLGGPDGMPPDHVMEVAGGASAARLIPVGDLDGDGAGDLAWLTSQGGWIVRGCSNGPALDFAVRLPCTNCLSGTVASGDINGDGLWDAVYSDGQITVAVGSRQAPTGAGSPPSLSPGMGALLMDLNGDGYSDLYAMQASGALRLFFGASNGLRPMPSPELPIGIDGFGDFDGDGHLDLVSWAIGNVRYGGVPSYNGGPLFGPTTHSAEVPKAQAGAVVDLNADGYDDLVLLVAGAGVEFLQGTPAGLAAPVIVPLP